MKDIMLGGGIWVRTHVEMAPAVCLNCSRLVVRNYTGRRLRCRKCKGPIRFYNEPELYAATIPSRNDEPVSFGSSEFSEDQFCETFTPQRLLEDVAANNIPIPQAVTEIESLNMLLRGKSLHTRFKQRFKKRPLSREGQHLIERVAYLSDNERIRLNRIVCESAFRPLCPQAEFPWDRDMEVSITDPQVEVYYRCPKCKEMTMTLFYGGDWG